MRSALATRPAPAARGAAWASGPPGAAAPAPPDARALRAVAARLAVPGRHGWSRLGPLPAAHLGRLDLGHVVRRDLSARRIATLEVVLLPVTPLHLACHFLLVEPPPPLVPFRIGAVELRIVGQLLIRDRRAFQVRAHVARQRNRLEEWLAELEPHRPIGRHDLPVHRERHADPIALDQRRERMGVVLEVIGRAADQQARALGLGAKQERCVPGDDRPRRTGC